MCGTRAAMLLALMAIVMAPAAANGATVGPGKNGGHSELTVGDSLTINLKPGNSGSTGYHWQFTRRPSAKILRLTSNHAVNGGKRQVLVYSVRGAGITSLKLRYRPPGKGKAVKTFSLTVLANEQEQSLDCYATPEYARSSLVAQSGSAVVFKIRRTLFFWQGVPASAAYDAYYGCDFSEQHAFPLGGIADRTRPHEFWNVTLRGNVVAYVHRADCPFDNRSGCLGDDETVESQDLHTGNLIRSVRVGFSSSAPRDVVTGLVVSPTGGIAWIEAATGHNGFDETTVHRSDAAAEPGAPYAQDNTVLDSAVEDGTIDTNSLLYDGTNVIWTQGGTRHEAPLH